MTEMTDRSAARLWGVLGATLGFVVTLVVGLTIVTIGLSDSRPSAAMRGAVPVDGGALYAQHCASCHGPTGEGGIGPELAGVVVERYPDPEIHVLIVEAGRGAMPAFGARLTDDQIRAVVDYERTELGS